MQQDANINSPYDGIRVYSDNVVSKEFWKLVQPAIYNVGLITNEDRYRYQLNHPLVHVMWGKLYGHLPNTIIRINPHTNNMTPAVMLDIISFILGDYDDVKVAKWDEKIDVTEYTSHEVAKRIYVPNKKSLPKNPRHSNSTYYYGSQYGEQVKVYNKAKQKRLAGQLTRIEKTCLVSKGKRKTLTEFLLHDRNDVFKNMNMVDIDLLDGRSKMKRLINSEKTLMHAYYQLTQAERKKFKRHPAFIYQCLDIHSMLKSSIEDWLQTSPLLRLKILVDHWTYLVSKVTLTSHWIQPVQFQVNIQLQGWDKNGRSKLSITSSSVPFEFN